MTWQWEDEKFKDLQAQGLCGEYQDNGRRCKNACIEWMPVDPDRRNGEQLGACGVHAAMVFQRLKNDIENRAHRWQEKWAESEFNRLADILRRAGFKINMSGWGANRQINLGNPAEFLATLHDKYPDAFKFEMYPPVFGPPTPEELKDKEITSAQAPVLSGDRLQRRAG